MNTSVSSKYTKYSEENFSNNLNTLKALTRT